MRSGRYCTEGDAAMVRKLQCQPCKIIRSIGIWLCVRRHKRRRARVVFGCLAPLGVCGWRGSGQAGMVRGGPVLAVSSGSVGLALRRAMT